MMFTLILHRKLLLTRENAKISCPFDTIRSNTVFKNVRVLWSNFLTEQNMVKINDHKS